MQVILFLSWPDMSTLSALDPNSSPCHRVAPSQKYQKYNTRQQKVHDRVAAHQTASTAVAHSININVEVICFLFLYRAIVLDIQIIKPTLFAPMYCFKNFYTLKPSTHIKINYKITPTCFGPTGPSSGSTSFLSQSYH